MRFIKSITQQKLCFLLAIYIGLLNIAIFYRRFEAFTQSSGLIMGLAAILELAASVLVTFFLLRVLSLLGRRIWQVLASLIVLCSVGASYYMTFLNVIVGYGIIASVMTTDIDLSKEVIGRNFVLWMVLVSALPLLLIWSNTCRYTLLRQMRTPGMRLRNLVLVLATGLVVWAPLRMIDVYNKTHEKSTTDDRPSYGGVVASSYLPSNWVSALGLYAWAQMDESSESRSLINPTQKYQYDAPANLDDTYVIFIIGETARWDHMGLYGYERDTTPNLEKEKNLVAFRGKACDTATKLSLRCMFVREGGVKDNQQRTVLEQNIFAVLKQLGFSSDLFAMQSELWFYANTMANNINYRETIAARHQGQRVDDMMLLDELDDSVAGHPKGKHLVILHTKGSHFSYSQRYTRDFAKWQPECVGIDKECTGEELINAYDNSILYTDTFIKKVYDSVRDKKAIVFYASDHGESISESKRLHGTPRDMAPPEQLDVPLLVWASDKYLEDPDHARAFAYMQTQAKQKVEHRHVEMFDSILGCLGYTSPNGGINENNNWCHIPQASK
ncbi:kdo(2)-lipid A phosphoethanolamine 7''-transferase [Enterobacteriaceae bacterium 4M9]|nr:kdo(2)-lipid A phosphoethanolamine 7''-transferase [Enterobacteriaceae bacterium 4M9]